MNSKKKTTEEMEITRGDIAKESVNTLLKGLNEICKDMNSDDAKRYARGVCEDIIGNLVYPVKSLNPEVYKECFKAVAGMDMCSRTNICMAALAQFEKGIDSCM